MNVFIVYAYPEPQSFNAALKNLAISELTGAGHLVRVSDLYAMQFKAVADREDFTGRQHTRFLKYQREQTHAAQTHGFCRDIQDEQDKLLWADFVIFQFPLWRFALRDFERLG